MDTTSDQVLITDPPIVRALFGSTRWAWIWLIVRLYVSYVWISGAIEKLQSPAWTGSRAGVALHGWVSGSLGKTGGANPDVQGWYAAFLRDVVLPHAATWSVMVSYGELCVGLGLLIGLFTGIAAFFGTVMSMSYMLGGSVSLNPILLGLGSMLVLAWKVAGYWGLDRWVLPKLGTPWQPGPAIRHSDP